MRICFCKSKKEVSIRGSTGSFWGDLVAYAIVGVIFWVIAMIWQSITGGGRGGKKDGNN